MIVEQKNNEIIIRFNKSGNTSRIQQIIEYLRYEELTAESNAQQKDVEELTSIAKTGRWERIKKEMGLDE